jgi:threonine dehydrogenase-like Zn-dependent dehydrogenase
MAEMARYAVLNGPGDYEIREAPLPEIGDEEGILAVEACGVCGTDVEAYEGKLGDRTNGTAPGHEPFGRVLRVGASAAKRWKVAEGDRVALYSSLSCGRCINCRTGREPCVAPGFGLPGYGMRSPDLPGGPLWGGFATHMYLAPEATLLPMSPSVSVAAGSLFSVMANGVDWVLNHGGLRPGMSVAVLGPGPRGLASVIAASIAGASEIAITGLANDRDRLELAGTFGADHVLDVTGRSTVDAVLEAMSAPPDMVIDCTPFALGPVTDAIHLAAPGGTIVLAGVKGPDRDARLPMDVAMSKRLTLKGVWSRSVASMEYAIKIIESQRFPLDLFATHAFSVEHVEDAIHALTSDAKPVHVRIVPQT